MREIEFRAWLKGERKMVEVKTIHFGTRKIMYGYSAGSQNYGNASCGFDDCEIMQFTGLKDKNGVKIYEGDILTNNCCNRQCEFHIQGYVQFDKEWGYVLKMYEEDDGESTWRFDVDALEIIGNIYDNPELIKESE